MSSPVNVSDSNQFDVLSSPNAEGKSQEGGLAGLRARFSKDDVKEQAFQAREAIKTKAVDLKEQVVGSGLINTVQANVASLTAAASSGIETLKAQVGLAGATNEEVVSEIQEKAGPEWEEVKRKGNKQMKKAAAVVDQKLDENLTQDQRAKLNKATRQAKKGAIQLERQAEGWSNTLINSTLRGPALRPVKTFIQRNNLQLPVVVFMSLFSLWLGLNMIRLVTSVATPKVPEFDIHSKEATMDWVKYHAGEYKDRAIDMRTSLSGRAAAFLANHQFDKMRNSAIDYRDIALNKLGLAEPTWGEWAWAKLTGRPITYQERVESVLNLAKDGLSRADLKTGGLFAGLKHTLFPEATLGDKIKAQIPGMKPVGVVEGLKNSIVDGIDTIRSHLPGGESVEAARQRAYEATHPSTIDQLKNGATYVKNRIVHGAQEAAHIAQDRANEAADKARYKTGL